MRDVLKLSKELKIHQESFDKIKYQLSLLYKDYSNKKVIVNLFEYWVLSFRLIYCAYGIKGLKAFFRSKQTDPLAFSSEYEFQFKKDLGTQIRKINFKWLFKLIVFVPLGFRLPGSPNILAFDRLRSKYTTLTVRAVPIVKDRVLEEKIIDIINLYLSETNIDLKIENVSQLCLPNIFKSRQAIQGNAKKQSIRCAPVELMNFNGTEDIFLINNKLKIIGFQHGGGYDNFDMDLQCFFEKKISSIFYGWGLSGNNLHQTRFLRKNIKSLLTATENRVVWIESPRYTKLFEYYYPLGYAEINDLNISSYIFNELKESGVKYYNKPYFNEYRTDKYRGKRGEVIDANGKAESQIKQGDLIIFDNCSQSLIYYCIENNIMFIIVSCKDLEKHYTDEMRKWHKVLRKNNLFFFSNELTLLSNKIRELSSNYKTPKDVIDFHYKKFINI